MVPGLAVSASPWRSLRDGPSLTRVRDCGRVRQSGSSGGREKRSDSGNDLKVEPTGFPDQLFVGYESTSEQSMSPSWSLSKAKNGVAFEMRRLLWVSE